MSGNVPPIARAQHETRCQGTEARSKGKAMLILGRKARPKPGRWAYKSTLTVTILTYEYDNM